MFIAVLSQKGGVGKSTVSALLAEIWTARGRSVQLIDGDIGQRTLKAVADASGGRIPAAEVAAPEDFETFRDSAEIVIADVGGGLGEAFFGAALVADAILLPCPASGPDLRTLARSVNALKRVTLARDSEPAIFVVPNRIALRERMSRDFLKDISQLDVGVTTAFLRDRSAYKRAGIAGLGALPKSTARPARREVEALADELEERLNIKEPAHV